MIMKYVERLDQSYKMMIPFIQVFNMINLFIMALGIGNVIVLDVQMYLLFWGGGLVGLLLLGTFLHRGKVFAKAWNWDFWIQKVGLWFGQISFGYSLMEVFARASDEQLAEVLKEHGKYLRVPEEQINVILKILKERPKNEGGRITNG